MAWYKQARPQTQSLYELPMLLNLNSGNGFALMRSNSHVNDSVKLTLLMLLLFSLNSAELTFQVPI